MIVHPQHDALESLCCGENSSRLVPVHLSMRWISLENDGCHANLEHHTTPLFPIDVATVVDRRFGKSLRILVLGHLAKGMPPPQLSDCLACGHCDGAVLLREAIPQEIAELRFGLNCGRVDSLEILGVHLYDYAMLFQPTGISVLYTPLTE